MCREERGGRKGGGAGVFSSSSSSDKLHSTATVTCCLPSIYTQHIYLYLVWACVCVCVSVAISAYRDSSRIEERAGTVYVVDKLACHCQ